MPSSSRNDRELAWAAGFFDGEGTITYTSRNTLVSGRRRAGDLYVGVDQAVSPHDGIDGTPPPVLVRFAAAMGGGALKGPYHYPPRRPLFKWYVRNDEADRVLALLWPFLSATKRRQALAVRALVNERRKALELLGALGPQPRLLGRFVARPR
jgi:hypothetical protein